MALSNPIFSVSGAATFLDARNDVAGLIVQDTAGLTRPGILWASQDNLVTGTDSLALDIHDFNANLERHGALLIANRGTSKVSIDAAPAANSRIDIIYLLQQEKQAPMSDGADGPKFGVLKGNAAAVPTIPSGLPEGALQLATVQIPAGASTTSAAGVVIAQTYPHTAVNGNPITFRSQTDMNQWAGTDGQLARLPDGTEYKRVSGAWVSQTQPRIITGRKNVAFVNVLARLFTFAEFETIAGRSFDNSKDLIVVMNGNYGAAAEALVGVSWSPNDINITKQSGTARTVQVNYAIILGV